MTVMHSQEQAAQLRRGADASTARHRSAWRRPMLALAGLLLGAAAIVGGGVLWLKRPQPAATPAAATAAMTVTATVVERGPVQKQLLVTGSLAARDELPLGTETSGLALADVLVDVGDHVERGQLLARFDDTVLRAQKQQAEASLHEAEANASEAAANARRAEELVKSGWISGKDFDNRRATALSMQARVGVAAANLALADAHLQQAQLRAPSPGTISQRSAHLGAVLLPGNELFRLIRDDHIELVAELPETDLTQVAPGQTVQLTVDGGASSGVPIDGRVRLVEPTVDVKSRLGRVRIEVTKSGLALPGMFVSGHIALGSSEALLVPERAVVYRDGKPLLFVIDSAGKVEPRSVDLGPRDGSRIAILTGVSAGERVALQGAGYLKSGDLVRVVDNSPHP
jgi:RND family efflux transporter MFP subunit